MKDTIYFEKMSKQVFQKQIEIKSPKRYAESLVKVGEFSSYKKAYKATSKQYEGLLSKGLKNPNHLFLYYF